MLSFKLAIRNLCRHRTRTLVTFLGISLCLAMIQGYHNFTSGVYSYMVECGVRSGLGHIAVVRDGYLAEQLSRLSFLPGALPGDLRALPQVKAVLPRVHLVGLAQTGWGSRRINLIGVDIPAEALSNPFLKNVPKNIFSGNWDEQSALVGARLVSQLKIGLNRPLVVTVQDRNGDLVSERFRVRGIIGSGIKDVDNSLVMVSWPRAARMAGAPGEVNALSLVLEDAESENTAMPRVMELLASRPELRAADWEKTMPNLYSAIRWEYTSVVVLSVILLLIVTFGVTNTLLMSVMERVREFGMMRSIGASGALIRRMILAEALALGVVSTLAGTAVASLGTWYLAVFGLDLRKFIPANLEFGGVIYSALLYAKWDIPWMLKSSFFMVALCVVASLFPALKASRITPIAAMRRD